MRTAAVLIALIAPGIASAWGTHCFVTDRALERADLPLDEAVPVEPLEAFLAAEQDGIAKVFDGYYAWLEERGSTRFAPQTFDEPTIQGFLRAARLNPDARIAYVDRLLPGEAGAPLALSEVSPWLRPWEPLRYDFVPSAEAVPARRILVTYSDEPDWGFDHELWAHTDYGYGEQPYGKPTGESSKAPFHMQFAHENGLVRTFASYLTEGMVPDRQELFLRLSKHAFATGHRYWGYRFAAWAMHYAQDVAQPYHAVALPSVGGGYYFRYIVSPAKERMKTKATQLAANRHFVYEDLVSYGLQQGYDADGDALAAALIAGDLVYDVPDGDALLDTVMDRSAAHARTIDGALMRAFPAEITRDWRYDLEQDADYRIDRVLPQVPEAEGATLLDETRQDFENTGRATRTVLKLAGAF